MSGCRSSCPHTRSTIASRPRCAPIREALGSLDGGLEIVVVDDGSSDGTADAARRAGADQVIVHDHNRGKGAAVRSGVLAATGRTVAFTDADLSYAPAQLARPPRRRGVRLGCRRRQPGACGHADRCPSIDGAVSRRAGHQLDHTPCPPRPVPRHAMRDQGVPRRTPRSSSSTELASTVSRSTSSCSSSSNATTSHSPRHP